jgi:hypothetical protein
MQAGEQTESRIVIQASGYAGFGPPMARVFVDGQCVGVLKDKSARTFPVPMGPHRVLLKRDFIRSKALDVSLQPEERVELEWGYNWRTQVMHALINCAMVMSPFVLRLETGLPFWLLASVVVVGIVASATYLLKVSATAGSILYLQMRDGSRHLPELKIFKPLIRSSLDSCLGRICVDLDDIDGIVMLLRRECRSVQIVAEDVLIDDSSQFERLVTDDDRIVKDLEIEAHDPFLRIRFDPRRSFGSPIWTQSEVIGDPNDTVAAGLRAQIEGILRACRRRGPKAIWAGLTRKRRWACQFAGLIAGVIITMLMVIHVSLAQNVLRGVTDILAPTFSMFAIVAVLLTALPCAPVLLLERSRSAGRSPRAPKPGPVAEL